MLFLLYLPEIINKRELKVEANPPDDPLSRDVSADPGGAS